MVNKRILLDSGWELRSVDTHGPLEAAAAQAIGRPGDGWTAVSEMPRPVHDVLLQERRIEPPWLPDANEKAAWVARTDWVYRTALAVPASKGPVFVLFHGLDTLADVYLDGRLAASHDNQYLPLKVDVTPHAGHTVALLVHFRSVFHWIDTTPVPESLRGRVTAREMLRKMSTEFHDYLGPKPSFTRVGIYDRVELICAEGPSFDTLRVGAVMGPSLAPGRIEVDASGSTWAEGAELAVEVVSPHGRVVARGRVPLEGLGDRWEASLRVDVEHPEAWWPRGYGRQPLYGVVASVERAGQTLERLEKKVGFRHIAMSQPFHFVVNGMPVKLRGAALAPFDLVTLRWNDDRAKTLLDWAENSHMNALRVWAEIGPMDDAFYRECDRRGLLVWQDFPTNGPIPDDPAHLEQFRVEATHYVNALRHHPCVLLWCGGNENLMWHWRSGSGNSYGADRGDSGAYPGWAVLTEVFADVVQRLDPERLYFPSTPYLGRFPNDPIEGTTHGYSHVWFVPGRELPNFTPEDTRVGVYEERSLRRFIKAADLWPEGYTDARTYGRQYPYPDTWVKHTANESWRKVGPVERFYDAHDLESLIYRIGAANEAYYGELIDRCRRGRFPGEPQDVRRNGGYLYWRLNDSWPMHFCARIDYFLEATRAYYAIRRVFAPVRVSVDVGNHLTVWVVNDTPTEVRGVVIVELFNPQANRTARRTERAVKVPAGQSREIARLDEFGEFRREHLVYARLLDDCGQPVDRDVKLMDNERSLQFPDAELTLEQGPASVIVTTDRYARCVQLSGDAAGDAFGWMFEDNYFDLLPGECKTVRVLGRHRTGTVSARAFYATKTTRLEYRAS
jgi:beta-mannosidase